MKWINGETQASKFNRKSTWHKWFAWFPVTVGEKLMPNGKTRRIKIWLSFVNRIGTVVNCFDGSYWSYDYKEIEK